MSVRPDRLAQLERAGLVPRLNMGQRAHLVAFIKALCDPHHDLLTSRWLEYRTRTEGGSECDYTVACYHDFDGPDAQQLGRLLAETFGIEAS